MPTTLNFKQYLDLPTWRPEAVPFAAPGAGSSFAWDHRNNDNGSPYQYFLRSATNFEAHDPITGEWMALASPALAGTFGAGAAAVFHPSQGPRGQLAAGNTISRVVLSTALPAPVGINQLANRGDGRGFRIRVIDNVVGGSGKIEERSVVGNTLGTTPTIMLDTPLSFTPGINTTYEIRAGRVYMLSAGALAAGIWKFYDIATNSFSANLATVNLPANIATDSNAVALSESHVPHDRAPGEGFVPGAGTYDGGKKCIVATATGATSITGAGMFADLAADEYRNFQVRVVEDSVNPTACNQRRRISTHTAGAAAVFTVAAWAVMPSATAKFVIENDDDKIMLRSSAGAAVYNYNINANTWDTTTWAAPVAHGTGVVFEQGFGYTRDTGVNARHSHVYCIRGGNSAAIDVLDIAGAATGAWANDIGYGKKAQLFTTGTSGAYDPGSLGGRLLHLNINGTQRFARFDMKNRVLDAGSYLRITAGVAQAGQRMANGLFIDGDTKLNIVYTVLGGTPLMYSLVIQP